MGLLFWLYSSGLRGTEEEGDGGAWAPLVVEGSRPEGGLAAAAAGGVTTLGDAEEADKGSFAAGILDGGAPAFIVSDFSAASPAFDETRFPAGGGVVGVVL